MALKDAGSAVVVQEIVSTRTAEKTAANSRQHSMHWWTVTNSSLPPSHASAEPNVQ